MLRESLKDEKARLEQLDQKVQRLTASLHDREEKLDRRERELARLRERSQGGSREHEHGAELLALQDDKKALEAQLAELSAQLVQLRGEAGAEGEDRAMVAARPTERERLQERLTMMARENRRLKQELLRHQSAGTPESGGGLGEADMLREQMNDLAAQVIRMTAQLDDPDSAIVRALAASPRNGQDAAEAVTSLADRVRALQQAAATR